MPTPSTPLLPSACPRSPRRHSGTGFGGTSDAQPTCGVEGKGPRSQTGRCKVLTLPYVRLAWDPQQGPITDAPHHQVRAPVPVPTKCACPSSSGTIPGSSRSDSPDMDPLGRGAL